MSDYRTILAAAATINFLQNQPGEFTPEEILEAGDGFHSDTDETDIRAVCIALAAHIEPRLQRVKMIDKPGYLAFSWKT